MPSSSDHHRNDRRPGLPTGRLLCLELDGSPLVPGRCPIETGDLRLALRLKALARDGRGSESKARRSEQGEVRAGSDRAGIGPSRERPSGERIFRTIPVNDRGPGALGSTYAERHPLWPVSTN